MRTSKGGEEWREDWEVISLVCAVEQTFYERLSVSTQWTSSIFIFFRYFKNVFLTTWKNKRWTYLAYNDGWHAHRLIAASLSCWCILECAIHSTHAEQTQTSFRNFSLRLFCATIFVRHLRRYSNVIKEHNLRENTFIIVGSTHNITQHFIHS